MSQPYAAIIPAYNESQNVANVIRPCLAAGLRQVLVVDDGSKDDTSDVALRAGSCVLTMPQNGGKARAMAAGVRAAEAANIIFLDADLTSLETHHVLRMIDAHKRGAQMVVGVIGSGTVGPSQAFFPILSGQRVLAKAFWQDAVQYNPMMVNSRFGVEVFLTIHANRFLWQTTIVVLDGVGHIRKEKKATDGFLQRLKMYREVMAAASVAAKGVPFVRSADVIKNDLILPLFRLGYWNKRYYR